MVQSAKVVSTDGEIAVVEVSRKAMCDGCHKTTCGEKCAMSSLMSSGSKMTASAYNKIGAEAGDTVEIETSDREVLVIAAFVFVLPVVLGCIFYAVAESFGLSMKTSVLLAVVGFVLVFPFLRLFDKSRRKDAPKLIIRKILTDESAKPSDDF